MLTYTSTPPQEPGWYWCRNKGDRPGETWEAVVHVDETPTGLQCSWMTAPGAARILPQAEWSPAAQWAGPLPTPADAPPSVKLMPLPPRRGALGRVCYRLTGLDAIVLVEAVPLDNGWDNAGAESAANLIAQSVNARVALFDDMLRTWADGLAVLARNRRNLPDSLLEFAVLMERLRRDIEARMRAEAKPETPPPEGTN